MIRSASFALKPVCHRRYFASRNVKVHKFLPSTCKNINLSKESNAVSPNINVDTIKLLEKVSLVGIQPEKGIEILEDAVKFANQIFDVDTANVKPLVSVLEDEGLHLRNDVPVTDITRSELISHCKVSEENYFITPVGFAEIPEEKISKLEKSEVSQN